MATTLHHQTRSSLDLGDGNISFYERQASVNHMMMDRDTDDEKVYDDDDFEAFEFNNKLSPTHQDPYSHMVRQQTIKMSNLGAPRVVTAKECSV